MGTQDSSKDDVKQWWAVKHRNHTQWWALRISRNGLVELEYGFEVRGPFSSGEATQFALEKAKGVKNEYAH